MVTVPEAAGSRHLLVDAPDTTSVGELHAALDPACAPRPSDPTPLRHGYGATCRPTSAGTPARVVVAAGPDAGASADLPPGRWVTVGRAPTCDLTIDDPSMSRVHVRVRQHGRGVEVEDLGSTNGLRWEQGAEGQPSSDEGGSTATVLWRPDRSLLVGSSRLELAVDPLPPMVGHDRGGRVHVAPWLRPAVRTPVTRLSTPPRPQPPVLRPPSAWSWALPLVASVVAALLLRMPMILVFGLMAPLMMLGHHLGERRSARREHGMALDQHAEELARLETSTREALARDLHARRTLHPGLLGVARALDRGPTAALWARGGEEPTVVLGEGRRPADVLLDDVPLEHPSAPVTLTMTEPVALIGPATLTAAAARSWLLQLASGHPPSQVGIVVDPEAPPGEGWDLLAWLPHTCPRPDPARNVNLVWGGGLLLLTDVRDAPAGMTQVVLTGPDSGRLRRAGHPDDLFRPSLLGLPLARHLARLLAPVAPDVRTQTSGAATLGDLLPWPDDAEGVRRAWARDAPELRVPLGTDESGAPVWVDLASDGPHALVAGTTGSGKSELLRTLVTGLALRNRPSRLTFLLVDYKGGSSLAECAELPHTTGLVTDLDPHLAQRVLVSLQAELRRRERVLAAAGARDVRDHHGEDLPRLVVVIDEFRVLAEELPDFLDGLVRVAAVGRSLGVHLILATQRPAGVVSADLRANVNLRISLRVRDATDSLDVLEVADAAQLPEGRPGLALLRTGSSSPTRLQVVPAAAATMSTGTTSLRVEPLEDVWEGWRRLHAPGARPAAASELGGLPALLARTAALDGLDAVPVWRPPLPSRIRQEAVGGGWALADRPEQQRQEPLHWDARTHVGVVGAARSGRSTAVRAMLASAGPTWLYVVDLARGLEDTELSTHGGLRGWVGPHDAAHGIRVLEVLDSLVDARLAEGPGATTVPVVLVIDGWDRFVDAYGELAGGRGRDIVLRVLRDGPAAGVVVLLTGGRTLLSGAVASEIPERWALRLHDPADLLVAGLRPQQVPDDQPPGRIVRTSDALVAQVAVADTDSGPRPGAVPTRPPGPPPPQVRSLPSLAEGEEAWAVGGDEVCAIPVPESSLLVLGPPGSGVTTTLRAIAGRLTGSVVHVDLDVDGEALGAQLATHTGSVVVDDAHLLAGSRAEDHVLAWATRTRGRLVVGGELEACGGQFRGLVPHVAKGRTGVVLQPSHPTQGAVLGVRLPVGDRPVPGRGVLVERGRCTRIQVVSPRPAGP